tara:strand:+ start:1680 stop:1922 length:243 start_codon:yes stop_codon:yes gene_type:complete
MNTSLEENSIDSRRDSYTYAKNRSFFPYQFQSLLELATQIFVFTCKDECWLLFLEPKVLRALIKNFLVSRNDYSSTSWEF